MGYDPLNGVGRLPQVTQDFISDPGGVGYDLSPILITRETQIQGTKAGSLVNCANVNFDIVNFSAFNVQNTANGTFTQILDFDLQKKVFLKPITVITYQGSGGATTAPVLDISVSEDGTNFNSIYNNTSAGGTIGSPLVVTTAPVKAKVVRITSQTSRISGTAIFALQRIDLKSDPYQY